MDRDEKVTPLKTIQGMIWEQGYRAGDDHGRGLSRCGPGLAPLGAGGLRLYVYSSGSVPAQKLLFGHSRRAI